MRVARLMRRFASRRPCRRRARRASGARRPRPRARPGPWRPVGRRPRSRSRRGVARPPARRPRAAPASRACDRPRRRHGARRTAPAGGRRRRSPPRAGRRTGPGNGWPSSGPGGRRARTRRSATAGGDDARRSRPRPLDRQPLAALVATALEDDATGTGLHASAEAVRPGALALLGLVGALHVGCSSEIWPDRGRRTVAATGRRRSEDTTAAPLHRLVHSPCTAIHRGGREGLRKILARFARYSRRVLRRPVQGPPAVAMFAPVRPLRRPPLLRPAPPPARRRLLRAPVT